jgi:ubiquinone/menaquinone biosynthesis C-methylase UbiE
MIKAAVQGAISRAPNSRRINEILQRYVTRSLRLTNEIVSDKWNKCVRHLEAYRRCSPNGTGKPQTVMEIGTGWYPIVPIGIALASGAKVVTVDTSDLLSRQRVLDTFSALARMVDELGLGTAGHRAAELADIARACSAAPARELLALAGVDVVVGDVRRLSLPDHSIDLFVSNNTLEHSPPPVISGVFRAMSRLASPGGLMSHHIDLADHYAGFDRSITALNFLKYSSYVWPLFNNDLQYQNRLRLSDYRRLHEAAGWQVLEEDGNSVDRSVLESIALAPEFRNYGPEDLCVYEAWLTSRPRGGDQDGPTV